MYSTSAAVFSLVLVLTGFAKLRSPADVSRALGAFRLPTSRLLGALIGAVEVVVGAMALVWAPALFAQGLLYFTFAIWVGAALRLDVPLASCGCLGRDDTPPTVAHLVLNVIAFTVSSLAATGDPIRLGAGLETVSTVVTVAVGVFLSYIVLTDGARLSGVRVK